MNDFLFRHVRCRPGQRLPARSDRAVTRRHFSLTVNQIFGWRAIGDPRGSLRVPLNVLPPPSAREREKLDRRKGAFAPQFL